jgi:tol-pal system protein YbgF
MPGPPKGGGRGGFGKDLSKLRLSVTRTLISLRPAPTRAYDPDVVGNAIRLALVGVLVCAGCGGPLARTRAENTRLESTVSSLRAEKRRDKRRIRELENQVVLLRAQAGSSGELPSLPVEVVGPGATPPAADRDPSLAALGHGAEVVGVAEDGTEIVYVGDAAAGKPGTLSSRDLEPDRTGRRATVPRTVARRAPASIAGPAGPPGPDDAAERYQQAMGRLRSGDHVAAVALLRELIVRHPRHELADNAQYWLGEAFYDQKDYPRAIDEFRKAASLYPTGNKVPDALLKLGFSHLAVGQVTEGRRALQQVVSVYPRSGPARLAAERLESLGGSP